MSTPAQYSVRSPLACRHNYYKQSPPSPTWNIPKVTNSDHCPCLFSVSLSPQSSPSRCLHIHSFSQFCAGLFSLRETPHVHFIIVISILFFLFILFLLFVKSKFDYICLNVAWSYTFSLNSTFSLISPLPLSNQAFLYSSSIVLPFPSPSFIFEIMYICGFSDNIISIYYYKITKSTIYT